MLRNLAKRVVFSARPRGNLEKRSRCLRRLLADLLGIDNLRAGPSVSLFFDVCVVLTIDWGAQ